MNLGSSTGAQLFPKGPSFGHISGFVPSFGVYNVRVELRQGQEHKSLFLLKWILFQGCVERSG